MHHRAPRLRELLRDWRARLHPADFGLPAGARRRVPGLRAAEVAELAEVSTGWYEEFEGGTSPRGFSAAFVHRVADALRLNDQERMMLVSLAVPAARIVQSGTLDGTLQAILPVRAFARRLENASSFEEAISMVIETAQLTIRPTCVTVASIQYGPELPRMYAVGPRTRFVRPLLAQCMLAMNVAACSGATVLCEDSPHPGSVEHGAGHSVRIRAQDGSESASRHEVPVAAYRAYNRNLLQRSELVTGLFENGTCRGVMSCSWTEPRTALPIDVAMIETLAALVALVAAPFGSVIA
jgi:hypothetical protein